MGLSETWHIGTLAPDGWVFSPEKDYLFDKCAFIHIFLHSDQPGEIVVEQRLETTSAWRRTMVVPTTADTSYGVSDVIVARWVRVAYHNTGAATANIEFGGRDSMGGV